MKKAFCILIAIICVFVAFTSLKTEDLSVCATEQLTVRFYYENTLLSTSLVSSGSSFVLPSITAFSELINSANFPNPPTLSGKNVRWRISSNDGEIAENNSIIISSSTDFFAELIDTSKTITYTFIYNYYSPNDYQKKVITMPFGASATKPEIYGLNDYLVYNDALYTEKLPFEQIASHDLTYFAKPNKKVFFSLNGELMSAEYGAPLSSIKGTETFKYDKFYLDEQHTKEYTYTLLDGLILYADKITTAYVVTLIDENEEQTLFVPLNDNILTSNMVGDGNWYTQSGDKISFPFEINSDAILTRNAPQEIRPDEKDENDKNNENSPKLSSSETTALIVVSCTLAFVLIASLVYEKFLKHRLKEKLNKKFGNAHKYDWDSKNSNRKNNP